MNWQETTRIRKPVKTHHHIPKHELLRAQHAREKSGLILSPHDLSLFAYSQSTTLKFLPETEIRKLIIYLEFSAFYIFITINIPI
jgi:hypothetical protein